MNNLAVSFIKDTVQSVNPNDFDDDNEHRPFAEADNESKGIFKFDSQAAATCHKGGQA
jgi:hypothetical protein